MSERLMAPSPPFITFELLQVRECKSDWNEHPQNISTMLCLIEITSWGTLIDFKSEFEEQNWPTSCVCNFRMKLANKNVKICVFIILPKKLCLVAAMFDSAFAD